MRCVLPLSGAARLRGRRLGSGAAADGQRRRLAARVGAPLELAGIAVRRPDRRARRPGADPALFTTDAAALVNRDDVDVVVEVIGGIEPARSLILHGAASRQDRVVTANKALLAEDGATLHDAAAERRRRPLLRGRGRRGDPAAAPAARVAGRRPDHAGSWASSTAPPTSSSPDGRHRRRLRRGAGGGHRAGLRRGRPDRRRRGLRRRGQGRHPRRAGVPHPGDRRPTSTARASPRSPPPTSPRAKAMGCTVKLLAICERGRGGRGSVSARVHPAMIPRTHPLAGVREAYNAVFVEAEAAGQLMFYGRGAGGAPTARRCSATWSRSPATRSPAAAARASRAYADLPVRPMGEARTRYHISLDVDDQPGVLAAVAGVFADHGGLHRRPCASPAAAAGRAAGRGHPPGRRTRPWPPPSRGCARWTSSATCTSVMRVEGD